MSHCSLHLPIPILRYCTNSSTRLCRIYDTIQDSPTPIPTNDPTTWYAMYIVGVSYNSLETWGDRVQSLRMATCVATGLHLFGQVMLLPGIWREVKWKVFKKIGADRKMRWRYSAFNLLVVQCKVNVYFAALAGAYFISHGWWSYSHTFLIITSAGYLVHTSGLIMLRWAVQKEKFTPVIVFLFLALLIEGILMVQLVKLWPILPFTVDKYFLIREVGSFFCVFNIFLLAACMLTATVCTLNFGGGLQKFVDASASDTGKASKGSGARTETAPAVLKPTGERGLQS
ncbi:hypothetical protein M427DRAFT_36313 [Gonapodya prolifera JEL478]|uniref:Uncharacterized protein n=1 Tax=Gonapodya prolifera (strain JEL478) TaxID=1344416 RepID=A0A139A3C9_GONPJ|nr:hypothetical protein M427DRAFT_36313 [Gonapodya prolifera JEL478]|eukprot:KXS11128.1 hypothetical protein M427DRAFT_36313 [Gonapodya prolifera JEL478]